MTVGATITDEATAWEGDYSPENLVTNLGNRGCSAQWNPLIAFDTATTDYNSCLRSNESLMSAFGHKYHLPFKLNKRVHNRGILIVEGHSDWSENKADGIADSTRFHA